MNPRKNKSEDNMLNRSSLLVRGIAVVFLALDSDEPRVIRAIGESWRLCRGKTLPTVTLRLSFLPLFLASCIPVGLPLLLYTLPCMLSTYVYYVDRLDGTAPLVAETAEEPETEESETETEVISETETEEIPEAEVIPEIETEENQSN